MDKMEVGDVEVIEIRQETTLEYINEHWTEWKQELNEEQRDYVNLLLQIESYGNQIMQMLYSGQQASIALHNCASNLQGSHNDRRVRHCAAFSDSQNLAFSHVEMLIQERFSESCFGIARSVILRFQKLARYNKCVAELKKLEHVNAKSACESIELFLDSEWRILKDSLPHFIDACLSGMLLLQSQLFALGTDITTRILDTFGLESVDTKSLFTSRAEPAPTDVDALTEQLLYTILQQQNSEPAVKIQSEEVEHRITPSEEPNTGEESVQDDPNAMVWTEFESGIIDDGQGSSVDHHSLQDKYSTLGSESMSIQQDSSQKIENSTGKQESFDVSGFVCVPSGLISDDSNENEEKYDKNDSSNQEQVEEVENKESLDRKSSTSASFAFETIDLSAESNTDMERNISDGAERAARMQQEAEAAASMDAEPDSPSSEPNAASLNSVETPVNEQSPVPELHELQPPLLPKRVVTCHPFNSDDPLELSFAKDEHISVLIHNKDGWWQGKLDTNGSIGLFPVNYVLPLPNDE
mmetsp:Transcript_4994/g.8676  ORF Transcript_4994/g.8676 Transcript_4994/m.8676 type:complete len:526 (-) Transcript_4994:1057-2634(-)